MADIPILLGDEHQMLWPSLCSRQILRVTLHDDSYFPADFDDIVPQQSA